MFQHERRILFELRQALQISLVVNLPATGDDFEEVDVQFDDVAASLGSDWRRIGSGVLGELDTRVLLEQWGSDHSDAARVAAGGVDLFHFGRRLRRIGQVRLDVKSGPPWRRRVPIVRRHFVQETGCVLGRELCQEPFLSLSIEVFESVNGLGALQQTECGDSLRFVKFAQD